MIWLAALLLFLGPAPLFADGSVSQDLQVAGQVGVNTEVPSARFHVQMSSADSYALKVSSSNGDPLLVLDRSGRAGIGMASPVAGLDVRGSADDGDLGLLCRAGNSTSTVSSSQLVFGLAGGLYLHSLRTRAMSSQNVGNAFDFFLWNSTASPAALGSAQVLSLEAGVSGSTAAFHVVPVGTPDAELEVSNGVTLGGGRIMYGSAGQHSERRLKQDIRYLDDDERAYADAKALRHAAFRYRGEESLTRGLIFEDAPGSIRGPGETLVLDYRVLQLESALRVVARELRGLEAELASLEQGR